MGATNTQQTAFISPPGQWLSARIIRLSVFDCAISARDTFNHGCGSFVRRTGLYG
ncbi:MAG: hypothetical protein ACREAB_16740 [Blastocatellia bacterium]